MRSCILAFIVYYIALLLVPCSDHVHLAASEKSTTQWLVNDSSNSIKHCSGENHHEDSNSNNDLDDCSPLCVCGCCHIVLSDQVAHEIRIESHIQTVYDFNELNADYQIDFPQNFLSSIFQPPKYLA